MAAVGELLHALAAHAVDDGSRRPLPRAAVHRLVGAGWQALFAAPQAVVPAGEGAARVCAAALDLAAAGDPAAAARLHELLARLPGTADAVLQLLAALGGQGPGRSEQLDLVARARARRERATQPPLLGLYVSEEYGMDAPTADPHLPDHRFPGTHDFFYFIYYSLIIFFFFLAEFDTRVFESASFLRPTDHELPFLESLPQESRLFGALSSRHFDFSNDVLGTFSFFL